MSDTYFFCGIGGSGMSALAAIMQGRGCAVQGSDRSNDQGQTPEKFSALERSGMKLFPQDGSGITNDLTGLVVSTAVENAIPDVKAAQDLGVPIIKRAELLARLFNESPVSISVAGTSGKSTVTGMLATILTACGKDPTVMNGGVMTNFLNEGALGNVRLGGGEIFLAETDESDGSIALYNPSIAILNNIALDHKSLDELDTLFGDFLSRTATAAILNRDDARVMKLASRARAPVLDFSLKDSDAKFFASDLIPAQEGISFTLHHDGKTYGANLKVPGAHNVANALAALAAATALEIPLADSITALESFTGIRRRLELVGSKNGITVIDDFAHNPDKIRASLETLRAFEGRLIVMFQPHGFGPLKMMGKEIAETFAMNLAPGDILFMPEAYYAGGTVDRSVTAKDVVGWVGGNSKWFETRAEIAPAILALAKSGDRIIIMGARDDTLTVFAKEILAKL